MLSTLLWPVSLVAQAALGLAYWWYGRRLDGFWVVDLAAGDIPGVNFHDQLGRVLECIRRHDPRRADRVRRQIRRFINTSIIDSGGAYLRRGRGCQINCKSYYDAVVGWGSLDEGEQRVLTLQLASIIVHEATHGVFYEAGIPYDERFRERIERRCRREQTLFMRRAAPDFQDACGKRVDWADEYSDERSREYYEKYWARSWWGRLRDTFARAWQMCGDPEGGLGVAWRDRHREYTEAADDYRPWAVSTLYTRASIHASANNHALAIEDYRRVLEFDPDHDEARIGLGAQLRYANRLQESLAVWREAEARGVEGARAWLAAALWQLEQHDEALEWFDQTADEEPTAHWLGLRAMLLTECGQHEEAIAEFERVGDDDIYAVGTRDFGRLTIRALVERRLGRQAAYEKTVDEIEKAVELWKQSGPAEPIATVGRVLQTAPQMFRSGTQTCGARLLLSQDAADTPALRADLERTARRLLERAGSADENYKALYARSLLSDNEAFPWREVPEELSSGRELWVTDVLLERILLPGGRLQGDWVDCWALSTDSGWQAAVRGVCPGFEESDRSKTDGSAAGLTPGLPVAVDLQATPQQSS
ncbi:MAG: hypothetical protein AAGA92_15200 [Planctomycetota bacterium]